jgi:hypothetical protein
MNQGIKKINELVMKDGRTLILTDFISDPIDLPEGTVFIDYTNGEMKYVNVNNSIKEWKHFNINTLFEKGSIDDVLFADNSLHAAKLIDLSIGNSKLADNSVTTNKIADKTITDSKFNLNSIDADKIKDGSISTTKIHSGAITTSLITDKSVTNSKVADKAITIDKMADNSVGTSTIVNGAITTSKLASSVVTNTQIADNAITSSKILAKEVKTSNIADLAVTTEKIADGAVQGKKIPAFGIKDSHIETLDGYKILDNTLAGTKLKNSTITTNLIADKAITTAKLDSNIQSELAYSLKISAAITIDGVEHYNTALITGNMVMKNSDGTSSNLNVNGNITATGDITGARVFNPYFADVAEAYYAEYPLLPGEPVSLSDKGGLRVVKTTEENIDRFLGFVSDRYASLLGGDKESIENGIMVPVCLTGRIKVKLHEDLEGEIGHYLNVFNYDGLFTISKRRTNYSIGRLLENKKVGDNTVLCQLWP